MKKLFAICFLIVFASCTAGQYMESSETSEKRNNIFAHTRKIECRIDIEKSIGRPIAVK